MTNEPEDPDAYEHQSSSALIERARIALHKSEYATAVRMYSEVLDRHEQEDSQNEDLEAEFGRALTLLGRTSEGLEHLTSAMTRGLSRVGKGDTISEGVFSNTLTCVLVLLMLGDNEVAERLLNRLDELTNGIEVEDVGLESVSLRYTLRMITHPLVGSAGAMELADAISLASEYERELDPECVIALWNFLAVQAETADDIRLALELQLRAVELCRSHCGVNSPERFVVNANAAYFMVESGDRARGLMLYASILESLSEITGKGSLLELQALKVVSMRARKHLGLSDILTTYAQFMEDSLYWFPEFQRSSFDTWAIEIPEFLILMDRPGDAKALREWCGIVDKYSLRARDEQWDEHVKTAGLELAKIVRSLALAVQHFLEEKKTH